MIDPSTIRVGQEAHFSCPVPDCSFRFWHTWIAADASNAFADPRCYKHGTSRPLMVLDEVRDPVPSSRGAS